MRLRSTLACVATLGLIGASCTGGSAPEPTVSSTTTVGATTTVEPTTSATSVPSTTTSPLPTPRGGQIVVGSDQEPPTLNPLAPGGDNRIVRALAELYAPGAFTVGLDLDLVPMLAWIPTVERGDVVVAPDGTLTVRWRINEDAVWSDGIPVSGDDFAFTLSLLGVTGDVPPIEAVETTAKSIRVRFSEPTVRYETLFTVIVPRHAVEDTDFLLDWNTRMWPSSGPFVISEWNSGQSLTLQRNDRFWISDEGPLPYLDSIEVRFIPEQERLLRSVMDGELDLALHLPDPTIDADAVAAAGARLSVTPGLIWEQLGFSFIHESAADGITASTDFRRAVALALDRDRLAREWVGVENHRMDGFVESQRSMPQGPWGRYPFDPEAAGTIIKDLCADSACPNGPLVTVSVSGNNDTRVRLIASVVEMLDSSGIPAEAAVWNVIDLSWWDVPWQAAGWAWQTTPGSADLVDLLTRFDPAQPIGVSTGNFQGWGTPASDTAGTEAALRYADLMTSMRSSVDPEAIRRSAAEAEAILAEEAVFIPLFRRPEVTAYRPATLGGYVTHPDPSRALSGAARWYRADR